MIQEIIIPKRKRLTINIPESLVGKRVEVIVKEAEKKRTIGFVTCRSERQSILGGHYL